MHLPDLPHVPDPLLILISLGFTGLLVILRLDAARFGAAEYDEADRFGHVPSLRRRFGWYALGIAGVIAVSVVHPAASAQLFLGPGDRAGAITWGVLYGVAGALAALAVAYLRYRHLRLPAVRSYPGALINQVATAFFDEAVFRGLVFGWLIVVGLEPNIANVIQALIYALATRTGASGRPKTVLLMVLVIGLVGGYLTGVTGGIGAAFLGHAVTRFAFFLTTGHVGQPLPRGREVEELEKRRRTPDGWRLIGPHETRDR
jgi:CAAX protease family protein